MSLFLTFALVMPSQGWTEGSSGQVPILVYHRFGPKVPDSMTVSTPVFKSHLQYLRDNHYVVVPLRQLVDHRLGKEPAPPARSTVITVDDGHRSVYTEMFPLVQRYRIPVTLFIYPSAISNADYALTWEQLRELKASGFFEIQSHTYWHPNFKIEKRRLSPGPYQKFVEMQLLRSKELLEKKLDIQVDMLAWPFGIYDDELIGLAKKAGYAAGFTLERRHTDSSDLPMALPRYLMVDATKAKVFERINVTSVGSKMNGRTP
jgi:peptidoglycan/xylan/chitin deacetylase (PgdA/CDA1 family)